MSTTKADGRTPAAGPREARGRSLGIDTHDTPRMVSMVRRGFSFRQVDAFRKNSGLSLQRIAWVTGIPPRTLSRRQGQGRLHSDESDRLLRVSRIFDLAVDLFEGNVDAARQWLESPQAGLGGEVPLDFASSEVGAREVENLIIRLEHGVFA